MKKKRRSLASLSEAERKRIAAYILKGHNNTQASAKFNVSRPTVSIVRLLQNVPYTIKYKAPISEAKKKQMYALRKKGLTYNKIAAKHGVVESTARFHCKLLADSEGADKKKRVEEALKKVGDKKKVAKKKVVKKKDVKKKVAKKKVAKKKVAKKKALKKKSKKS